MSPNSMCNVIFQFGLLLSHQFIRLLTHHIPFCFSKYLEKLCPIPNPQVEQSVPTGPPGRHLY